jgi:hypothetical protein
MAEQKATDDEILRAHKECGSLTAAAQQLGINLRTLQRRLAKIKADRSPDMPLAPEGYSVTRTSELTDEDGKPEPAS